MSIDRRQFLVRTGLFVSAQALASARATVEARVAERQAESDSSDWRAIQEQFAIDPTFVHMAGLLLSTHPHSVRNAINVHRQGLDANPVHYLHKTRSDAEAHVLAAAAKYMGVSATDIALTDSTTMGLGLLYTGIQLDAGQEALTTDHDHYSTRESLELRARRTGAKVRQIPLYSDIHSVSQDEIVNSITTNITPATRLVALTWVHSSTGLKLPIRQIADALAHLNAVRSGDQRVLLSVDGVHGFGIENVEIDELGCDFFVAGTHKWIFGPRGTGVVWGDPASWDVAVPTIPTFSGRSTHGRWMTPGGFHSFEHRWALAEAFEFLMAIGKEQIHNRIHALNRHLKEGMAKMEHLVVHTPMSDDLSSGIVCFDHRVLSSYDVVSRLENNQIVASVAPYASRHARLTPGLLNTHEEVDRVLGVLAEMG